MGTFEDASPFANKLLNPDGSITTLDNSTIISPPSAAGIEQFNNRMALANKLLNSDGSITTLPSGGGGCDCAIKSDSLFTSTYIEIETYTLNFIYEYTGTDPKTLMTDEELALLLFKCNPLYSLDEFTYQDLVTMGATQFKYIKQEYIPENDGASYSYESRINCLTSMNGDNIEFYINFIMDMYSGLNINKVLVVITTNGEIVEQEEVSVNGGVLISMDALATEEVYRLRTTDKTIVGAINEVHAEIGDKSDFDGDYNSLTNKPDLTVYATKIEMDTAIQSAISGSWGGKY